MKIAGIFIIFLTIGLLLTAGCADPEPVAENGVVPDPARTPDPVTTPEPGAVQAVSYTQLVPFLPDAPAGWTAGEPDGATLTMHDWSWATAERDYRNVANPNQRADIVIVDSAYYAVGGFEAWGHFMTMETPYGYYRSGTVAGFPAWEVHEDPSYYAKWIGINERFMVVVTIEDGTKADLDRFVNAVDYRGIAALG